MGVVREEPSEPEDIRGHRVASRLRRNPRLSWQTQGFVSVRLELDPGAKWGRRLQPQRIGAAAAGFPLRVVDLQVVDRKLGFPGREPGEGVPPQKPMVRNHPGCLHCGADRQLDQVIGEEQRTNHGEQASSGTDRENLPSQEKQGERCQ